MKKKIYYLSLLSILVSLIFLNCMAQDYVFNDGYRVGGNVVRNVGKVVLKNTVTGETAAVTGNRSFIFPITMEDGDSYSIVVDKDPADQTCTVYNGNGTISGGDVDNVGVVCNALVKKSNYSNPGGQISLNSTSYIQLGEISPITISVATRADVLITFTTNVRTQPDISIYSFIRLLVDGTPVSQSRSVNNTISSGYFPITFMFIQKLEPGTHTVSVEFSVFDGFDGVAPHDMIIDGNLTSTLTAIALDSLPGYDSSIINSLTGADLNSPVANTWLDISGLGPIVYTNNYSTSSKCLVAFQANEMTRDTVGSLDLSIYQNGIQHSTYSINANGPAAYVPITFQGLINPIIAGASLDIRTRWQSNTATQLKLENTSPAFLSAAFFNGRGKPGNSIDMSSYSVTNGLSIGDVNYTNMQNYNVNLLNPSRLLVVFNSCSSYAAGTGIPNVYYQIVAGGNEVVASCASFNGLSTAMPLTLVGITDTLPAGNNTIQVNWKRDGMAGVSIQNIGTSSSFTYVALDYGL